MSNTSNNNKEMNGKQIHLETDFDEEIAPLFVKNKCVNVELEQLKLVKLLKFRHYNQCQAVLDICFKPVISLIEKLKNIYEAIPLVDLCDFDAWNDVIVKLVQEHLSDNIDITEWKQMLNLNKMCPKLVTAE